MDVKQLAQNTFDDFNDRSFRQKAKDVAAADIVVTDGPSGQQFKGPEGLVQFSQGFVDALPDIKAAVIEHKVNGNKVSTRVRGTGTFTGTLHSPQGDVPGNGNKMDTEYQMEQEFNDAGKLARFTVNYNMQEFMKQLGLG